MTGRRDLVAKLLRLGAASSLVLLAAMGWRAWISWRSLADMEAGVFRAIELTGAARQSAQNRRQAAVNAIAAPGSRGRGLHSAFQMEWALALEEVKALAPAQLATEAGRTRLASESAMFDIEKLAIELAAAGQPAAAAARLSSQPYIAHRDSFALSDEKIAGWLRDRMRVDLSEERHRAALAFALFAGGFPLTGAFWLWGGLLSWRRASERRLAEARLREGEQRLRTLFEGIEDAVIVHNLDGRILDCNAAAGRRLGYTREELLARSAADIESPAFHAGFAQRCARQVARGVDVSEGEHRAKDGRLIPVDINARVITFRGGPAVLATVRDITARKQIQAALEQTRAAAEAASAAKSQFLANMSHEIRTPMNGVIGMTDLALGTDLSAEQREYLESARISADALLRLVNDVLDFSKIEAGKLELEPIEFRPRECAALAVATLAPRAREKGVELAFDAAPDLPESLLGDAGRLRQVLLNLIGNAVKFTDTGSVRVRVETAPSAGPGPVLRFTVADTGIGIAASQLKTIFEPFRQGDGSTTRRFGGTGLGLSICSQLVALMGGEISVSSNPGEGSVFEFTAAFLPAAAPEPAAVPAVAAPSAGNCARPRRILCAEDNPVNQRLLTRMLEKQGHSVVLAANGREAVEAHGRGRFDIALFDIQMPEMSGLEATSAIRAAEAARAGEPRHLPIIAVTANAMKGDRERCLAAGMDGYIAKPVKQGELFEMMEKALIIQESAPAVRFDGALFDGDPAFLAEIVNLFLETCPDQLSAIAGAIAQNDGAALGRAAHAFKGSVANFGADAIVSQAGALELMGKAGDLTHAGEAWQVLQSLMLGFTPLLRAELEKIPVVQGLT